MLLEAALADFSEQTKWTGGDEPDGGGTSKSAVDASSLAERVSSDEERQHQQHKSPNRKKQQERSGLKTHLRGDQQRAGSRRSNSTDSSGNSDVDERQGGTMDFVHEGESADDGRSSSSANEATLEVISLDRTSGGTSSSSSMNSDDAGKVVNSPGRSGSSESSGSGDEERGPLDSSMYRVGHGGTIDEPRHVHVIANSVKRSGLTSEVRHNAIVRLRRTSFEEVGTHLQQQQKHHGNADERIGTQSHISTQAGEVRGRSTSDAAIEWKGHPSAVSVPKVQQEQSSSSSVRRCDYPSPFRSTPVLRTSSAAATSTSSTSGDGGTITERYHVTSPPTSSSSRGIEKKAKSVLPSGKDTAQVSVRTNFAQRRAPQDWRGNNRDNADPDSSSVYSDDASGSSPVSTLDLPFSPHSPTYSPSTQEEAGVGRHDGSLGSTADPRTPAPSTSSTQHPSEHPSTGSTLISLGEMADELPSVLEEDEEDLESGSGFHTIEFETSRESPEGMEGREDWSLSGKAHSTKSLSAPHSRQGSSLHPGPANRGRRRSDFDWPEDFDERPEEVVKEVDDSLWAFSPVASTFVFSGNEASPSIRPGLTRTSSPDWSPGAIEHMSLKRKIVKSAFAAKQNHGSKSSVEANLPTGDFPARPKSSRFQQYNANGKDEYFGGATPPVKKSAFSCLPLFSLCGSQRPRPSISFSQRLSPSPRRSSPRR